MARKKDRATTLVKGSEAKFDARTVRGLYRDWTATDLLDLTSILNRIARKKAKLAQAKR